jgi:hypothetical protein
MKRSIPLLTLAISSLALFTAHAQFGGGAHGSSGGNPNLTGAMLKLFGDNQVFTANLEFQISDTAAATDAMTLPGRIKFDGGKCRFDMNMSDMKGGAIPPGAAAQFKAMGMDAVTAITRPDFKSAYLIYPGMQSYVVNPAPDNASTNLDDYKMDATKIGEETLDGHACVENKVTVTEKDGTQHLSTVWNATDMKNFPIKIETNEENHKMIMLFTAVSFAKPDAALFDAPAGFTKYDSMQSLMQAVITKRMGSQGGMPPH